MFADAKLHDANFKIFVRFCPVKQYEQDEWKEVALTKKLDKCKILYLSNKLKCFKDPKNWHIFKENNEKNNMALSKAGLKEMEQRMFRKLLKMYTSKELAEESEEEAIAFKLHARENQLVTVDSVTGKEEAYSYDEILWYDIKQGPAFNRMGYKTVEGVLNGINGTIFAYGQVGSGKTYSLLGPEPLSKTKPNEFGILPRAVQHIFRSLSLKKHSSNRSEITVSFLEIYLGHLKDLVEPFLPGKKEKNLHILNIKKEDYKLYMAEREGPAEDHKMKIAIDNHKSKENDSSEITVVQNLSEHPIKSIKEFYNLLIQAIKNRTTNWTLHNPTSSRGHMICQVKVKMARNNGIETVAKLNIVDLAGDENISKTKPEGKALTEAKSINGSLLAFREVIDALAKGKRRVPFRESKISMILKDSLGGNTRTSMLITLSPHQLHYDDSINNLKFGKRAKFVANKVKVNVKLDEQELIQMMQQKDAEIYKLRKQLEVANRKVKGQARKLMNETPDSWVKLAEIQDSNNGKRDSEEAFWKEEINDELATTRASSSNLVERKREEITCSEMRNGGWVQEYSDKSERRRQDTNKNAVGEKRGSIAIFQPPKLKYWSVEDTVLELEHSNILTESDEDLEENKYELCADEVEANHLDLTSDQTGSTIHYSRLKDRISELEKKLIFALRQRDNEKEAKLKLERKFHKFRIYHREIELKRKMKRKHGRKRKNSRLRAFPKIQVQSQSIESIRKINGLSDEKDNTEEMSRKVQKKRLPPRVKLQRTRLKRYKSAGEYELNYSEERQSVEHLTGLTSPHWESLRDLNNGDLLEETLKVWLMMMMSIQDIAGKGDHKLISLSDFFNFHIELSWTTQSYMSIAQMFGILDNTNMGGISEWELTTFFQQVRRIDALKWGFSADCLDMEMSLSNLTEVIELSHFLSKATFERIDMDWDGLVSVNDVSAYFNKIGGRKWWGKGNDFSRQAINEVLTRVHLMKWQGAYWKINQGFVTNNPPGVTKHEFDYFLVEYCISSCWLEIIDDLMETLPMEQDRFKIFEGFVPDWRDIFKWNETTATDSCKGLSVSGAQEIVSRMRSKDFFDTPAVSERDIAVIYLQGLSQTQMEMVVRSCPVKIWQSLVDETHTDSCTDRVEEFRKLEERIANSLGEASTEEHKHIQITSTV